MSVSAVIWDWAGTLTPWHEVDPLDLWRRAAEAGADPEQAENAADTLLAAERELSRRSREDHGSATLHDVFAAAGITATEAFLAAYLDAWTPHTFIDPDAPALLTELQERGIMVGVLSNTTWSRKWHDQVFARDGVFDLLDATVYSSELPWTKPHPGAFHAAMDAVGVGDPGTCVYVGDPSLRGRPRRPERRYAGRAGAAQYGSRPRWRGTGRSHQETTRAAATR